MELSEREREREREKKRDREREREKERKKHFWCLAFYPLKTAVVQVSL
jgi:hypothetical protein